MNICKFQGCKRSVLARGWCSPHYAQWLKYGTVTKLKQSLTTRERFRLYVQKTETCWLWTGAVDKDGYGRFAFSSGDEFFDESGVKGQVGAHQFSLAMKLGRWPTQQALHRCDVPGCVRAAHLYEGSYDDNARDRVERGQAPRGEGHGRSKITEQDVRDVRSGARTARQVAEERGVTTGAVYHAKNGRNWKWL